MIDKLVSLGKEQLSGDLMEKFGLTSQQTEKTMDVTKTSVVEGIKEQVLGGNISGVMDLFNGKADASQGNPVVKAVSQNFVGGLMEKLGISKEKSGSIANLVIPFIMKKFGSSETGEAKTEADLMSMIGLDKDSGVSKIMGSLGGAKDIVGGLGKFF